MDVSHYLLRFYYIKVGHINFFANYTNFTEYAAAINAVSAELEHRHLIMAAQQTARRLCTTLGAWANPQAPMATREIMGWATNYTITHLRAWLEQYSTLGNDGEVSIRQKVLQHIASKRSAGCTRGELQQRCWDFRDKLDKTKRDALIDLLIEDENIAQITVPGTGKKPKKVLVLTRYVRQTEAGLVKA